MFKNKREKILKQSLIELTSGGKDHFDDIKIKNKVQNNHL